MTYASGQSTLYRTCSYIHLRIYLSLALKGDSRCSSHSSADALAEDTKLSGQDIKGAHYMEVLIKMMRSC